MTVNKICPGKRFRIINNIMRPLHASGYKTKKETYMPYTVLEKEIAMLPPAAISEVVDSGMIDCRKVLKI